MPPYIRKFIDLFQVTEENPDLVLAQYMAFSKQIPLLYITLVVNSWALAYSFINVAPPVLALYVPAALTFVCVGRIVVWCLAIGTPPDFKIAFQALNRTNRISSVLAFLFSAWGLSLYRYGDAYAQGHVVFFMGITVIGCVFCLMHLRSAALRVMLTVNTIFVAFFVTSGNHVFVAISLNIVLVSMVMIIVLWVYYTGFVDLIESRKALSIQQHETQLLSDDNDRLANLDSLTGLPNRRRFFAELEAPCDKLAVKGTFSAVGIVDLDGFKAVNDSYGHAAGDNLLQVVADSLRRRQGADLVVARLGGDEFGLIFRNLQSQDQLVALGEDICRELGQPIIIAEGTMFITASIGFAVMAASDCIRDAFENADYALYDAKRNGKAKAIIFTPAHREAIQKASKMERAFEHQDLEKQLTVEFQPIIEVETGRVLAFEALARWNSPELGQVPPSVFIPAAERSGLIVRLTATLLGKALAAAKEWPGDIRLSFNLSAKDITSADAMARLLLVISRSGFDRSRIDFEITETAAIVDLDQVQSAIRTLKAWGVHISLDDFGTGYSTLSQIHQLDLDTIKIDQSFVTDITTNPMSYNIVKSVLALSRDMNIRCIVEGVETQAALDVLRTIGCHFAQGYHFARPMPSERLHDYLTSTGQASLNAA